MKTGKLVPIYLRVTINGRRFEVSVSRAVSSSQWSAKSGKMKGYSEQAKSINDYLDLLRNQVHAYQYDILLDGKAFTVQSLRDKWLGLGKRNHTLLETIRLHNSELEKLVEQEQYQQATLVKYRTTERHIMGFLQWKFHGRDFYLKDLRLDFVKDFEFYLKSEKGLSINSYGKVIKNLKKIIGESVDKGWLERDPFERYRVKHIDPKVPHLSTGELMQIAEKQIDIERLSAIKDIFLFSCYTGFAYIDVFNLTIEHFKNGTDGKKWLIKYRQKTGIAERVPLLPAAIQILDKYKEYSRNNKGKLLPVPSNQKVNAYLKELAIICDIHTPLSFHVARHTFATTVAMENGVVIESVSAMLGHKYIKTTQAYARVSDYKISQDTKKMFRKFMG